MVNLVIGNRIFVEYVFLSSCQSQFVCSFVHDNSVLSRIIYGLDYWLLTDFKWFMFYSYKMFKFIVTKQDSLSLIKFDTGTLSLIFVLTKLNSSKIYGICSSLFKD